MPLTLKKSCMGTVWTPSSGPRRFVEGADNFDEGFKEDPGECYRHGADCSASAGGPRRGAYGKLISSWEDVIYPWRVWHKYWGILQGLETWNPNPGTLKLELAAGAKRRWVVSSSGTYSWRLGGGDHNS